MTNEITVQSNSDNHLISFKPETREQQIKLYNAINSPTCRIADMINTPFDIADVVVCNVELSDDETKSGKCAYRTIIIDSAGESYTATSTGIYNSIMNIYKVFGTLHFDEPLKVTVRQIKTKNGNTLSLSVL